MGPLLAQQPSAICGKRPATSFVRDMPRAVRFARTLLRAYFKFTVAYGSSVARAPSASWVQVPIDVAVPQLLLLAPEGCTAEFGMACARVETGCAFRTVHPTRTPRRCRAQLPAAWCGCTACRYATDADLAALIAGGQGCRSICPSDPVCPPAAIPSRGLL
jgi:hypothetical protein